MKASGKLFLVAAAGTCAGFALCYITLVLPAQRTKGPPKPQTVTLYEMPRGPQAWQPKHMLPVLPPKVAGQ